MHTYVVQDFVGSFPSPSDYRTAKIPRFSSSSNSSLPTPGTTITTTTAAAAAKIHSGDEKDIVNLTDDVDGDDMDADLQEALKLSQTVEEPDLSSKADDVASTPLKSYHSCVFSELVGFGISQSLLLSDHQVRFICIVVPHIISMK